MYMIVVSSKLKYPSICYNIKHFMLFRLFKCEFQKVFSQRASTHIIIIVYSFKISNESFQWLYVD